MFFHQATVICSHPDLGWGLAEMLDKVKGKFILSLNDHPGVREVFGAFNLEKVKTRYSVGAIRNEQVGELLITNFKSKT